MRPLRYSIALVLLMAPALAQDEGVDCDAVYDEIAADTPVDLASCEVTPAGYTLEACTPPNTTITPVPKSHIILAMDASGSMAGQIGGETKMQIAKREALAFLRDLPQEMKVGLVVYGHTGNNQEDGKALSCATSELVHGFGQSRSALEQSIAALTPTGWTPLAGVLEFSQTVLSDITPPREGDLAPVVYLISDGEETCEGDPVAAARQLYESGVQTTVNTIGFDVDEVTAAQLQAIADAAGGIYYPARDAQSLRRQLDTIRQAESELARYQYCVNANVGRIGVVYHNARIEMAGCFQRNNPQTLYIAVLRAVQAAERDGSPIASCADRLMERVTAETRPLQGWLNDRMVSLSAAPQALIDDYRASMRLTGSN